MSSLLGGGGGSSSSGLVPGTTAIAPSTDQAVLFDRAGTLGEDAAFKWDYTNAKLNVENITWTTGDLNLLVTNNVNSVVLGTAVGGGSTEGALYVNGSFNFVTAVFDSSLSGAGICILKFKNSLGAGNWQFGLLDASSMAGSNAGFYLRNEDTGNGACFAVFDLVTTQLVQTDPRGIFAWGSIPGFAGSDADTGFSRLAAGSVALGNGTSGDYSGTLKLSLLNLASLTVASLPAPAGGNIAYVTDGDAGLAAGATVVNSGAGATKYCVFDNGTNWTVMGF